MKRKPYMVRVLIARCGQDAQRIGPMSVAEAQRRFPDWSDSIAATSRDGGTRCHACDAGQIYISRAAERAS